ncbi:hypothetical protein ACWD1Y_29835 [Streptomyces sp. NPDC002814]
MDVLHLTAPAEVIRARLLNRDSQVPALADITALLAAYQTVFTTLAQSIPVITFDTTAEGPPPTE